VGVWEGTPRVACRVALRLRESLQLASYHYTNATGGELQRGGQLPGCLLRAVPWKVLLCGQGRVGTVRRQGLRGWRWAAVARELAKICYLDLLPAFLLYLSSDNSSDSSLALCKERDLG